MKHERKTGHDERLPRIQIINILYDKPRKFTKNTILCRVSCWFSCSLLCSADDAVSQHITIQRHEILDKLMEKSYRNGETFIQTFVYSSTVLLRSQVKPNQAMPSKWNDFFFFFFIFVFFVTLTNSFWLTSRVPNVSNVVFVVDSRMRLLDYIFNRFDRLHNLTLKGIDYNLNFSIKLNSLALIIQIKCCVLLKPLAHMHKQFTSYTWFNFPETTKV